MKKIIITLMIILIFLVAAIIFLIILNQNSITGEVIKSEKEISDYAYSFTKAICNETNYCQDYEIVCNRNKTMSITPITGAAVQFSDNWKDSRDEKSKERMCG